MTEVNVWVNDGRWIVRCPACRLKTELHPRKKMRDLKITWYCGNCHPGKIERFLRMTPEGKLSYAYSRKAQMRAAEDAYNAEGIHTAVFPKDWKEAERILRLRHKTNQHYRPHEINPKNGKAETVADLKEENETEARIMKPIKLETVETAVVERKELPPEIYKELQ